MTEQRVDKRERQMRESRRVREIDERELVRGRGWGKRVKERGCRGERTSREMTHQESFGNSEIES